MSRLLCRQAFLKRADKRPGSMRSEAQCNKSVVGHAEAEPPTFMLFYKKKIRPLMTTENIINTNNLPRSAAGQ